MGPGQLEPQPTVAGVSGMFASFEPRLRAALTAWAGPHDVDEAVAETFAYLCANEDRIMLMENPRGYLYRVARSKLRGSRRKPLSLPPVPHALQPEVEPALPAALGKLTAQQRTTVFLMAGMGWTATEVAELLEISPSTVRNHYERGLTKLRSRLGGVEQ